MDNEEYANELKRSFDIAYGIASKARERGYDPEPFVEIRQAPDLASRVEGIIGMDGLAEIVRSKSEGRDQNELAFEMVKTICTEKRFDQKPVEERLLLAIRVALAVFTDAVVVAPTEGIQGVELHRNPNGSDYVAVLFAGPIRGAGGTGAAMPIAFADYGRKLLGIGSYKAQPSEIERTIEEIQIYHTRIARLQYYPPENDIKTILENLSVSIDGIPSEQLEVNIHRNTRRLDRNGKEQLMTNKVRGGIGLVICEGIAQKAKKILKNTKAADLDWKWLNNIIKFEKTASPKESESSKDNTVFLQELVAGRPVLAYPNRSGSFRLRYGRSRLTGINAKGFSPATMFVLGEFIACGTQVRVEKPGKGCIAAPVDSIEGPFVKLESGEALRINGIGEARELSGRITKIISVGDILITYGDFKKSNTPMLPTSYVEEYWTEQLRASGFQKEIPDRISFREAFAFSKDYNVPMHPLYIYDYSDISTIELIDLSNAVSLSHIEKEGDSLFVVKSIKIPKSNGESIITETLERLCIPHIEQESFIIIENDHSQSLLASLGFARGTELYMQGTQGYDENKTAIENINAIAPFRVMKRSTRIGARIGRPEKAKERLMKPAPNVLFPVGEYGGKERSLFKAYNNERKKFDNSGINIEIARYRCAAGKEVLCLPYCKRHSSPARLENTCQNCARITEMQVCQYCGGKAFAKEQRHVNIKEMIESAMRGLEEGQLNRNLKGVKGLMNRDKIPEPIEKGILRAMNNVHIFKDGTARFDATNTPITHFYPREIGVGVERLRALGYDMDFLGNEIKEPDQLVEMYPQDVIINRDGAEFMLNISRFIDQLLVRFYKLEPFYNANSIDDLIGHCVITLSPHTSAGVLCRIIGFTDAHVGYAHPYTITARRRDCDGDEDTTMMLLDALINFSKRYLPVTIGGTMDAPLILTAKLEAKELNDEVQVMEVTDRYGLDFYERTNQYAAPSELQVDIVETRVKSGSGKVFKDLMFTHLSGVSAIMESPHKSMYTKLNTMRDKIEAQFKLIDMLSCVDRPDSAKRLLLSHFIPDLIGNMHSFSRQGFRCVACNAKYRRVPLIGKCTRCKGGKLVLTISKGSIEKYLNIATELANRYNLEPYIKQRLVLIKEEINNVFGGSADVALPIRQFNLSKFM